MSLERCSGLLGKAVCEDVLHPFAMGKPGPRCTCVRRVGRSRRRAWRGRRRLVDSSGWAMSTFSAASGSPCECDAFSYASCRPVLAVAGRRDQEMPGHRRAVHCRALGDGEQRDRAGRRSAMKVSMAALRITSRVAVLACSRRAPMSYLRGFHIVHQVTSVPVGCPQIWTPI